MAVKNLTVRIDSELHAQAVAVYEAMGLDITTAIRMFLAQSVIEDGLPFQPTTKAGQQRVSYQIVTLPERD